jgi:hypothetical protein
MSKILILGALKHCSSIAQAILIAEETAERIGEEKEACQ